MVDWVLIERWLKFSVGIIKGSWDRIKLFKNKIVFKFFVLSGNIFNKKVYFKVCKFKEKGFDRKVGNDCKVNLENFF